MKYSALLALVFAASAFAQEAQAEQQQGSMFMGLLPFILMFVVMYLFFIMPKQKEMKKLDAMRKALKKGDKVLFAKYSGNEVKVRSRHHRYGSQYRRHGRVGQDR